MDSTLQFDGNWIFSSVGEVTQILLMFESFLKLSFLVAFFLKKLEMFYIRNYCLSTIFMVHFYCFSSILKSN